MSREALLEIRNVLGEFFRVSGLSLNVRKTQLMVTGTEDYQIGSTVEEIEVVSCVKILGVIIDRKLERLGDNWDEKIRKMERLGNFWSLQKLSIIGRLMVAKTFLLSQVIFLMDTLPLSHEHGEKINKILAYHVKGGERIIAKNRWFLPLELGGYGLIDVHSLNYCMKASWINRWIINPECRDINGNRGVKNFDKPVDQWGPLNENRLSDKFTYGILYEWKNYKRMFYKAGNIGHARIFENDGIIENCNNAGFTIFGRERYLALPQIVKLKKVSDFFIGGVQMQKAEIEHALGIRVNMAEYFRMRNFLSDIQRIYGNINAEGMCLDEFIRSKKRKGGQLRKVLFGKKSSQYLTNDPRRIPSAITLWGEYGLQNCDRILIEQNFSLWGYSKFPTGFRSFLFKYVQGRLYLNNALAHINGTSNVCTFCEIEGRRELNLRGIGEDNIEFMYYLNLQPVETTSHLFWECTHVQEIIQRFYRWVRGLDWYRGNEVIEKSSFFLGVPHEFKGIVTADLTWKHYVKYYIFQCRLRKKLPTFASLKYEFGGIVSPPSMRDISSNLRLINVLY